MLNKFSRMLLNEIGTEFEVKVFKIALMVQVSTFRS